MVNVPLAHTFQIGAHLVTVLAADGDCLGGLMSLLVWQPGAEIVDVRQVNVSRRLHIWELVL